jgi:Zn finger protein HypA/HybF involved in hydrogenase expression
MPIDESLYPTRKFMRCKSCKTTYAASLSGANECPECSSQHSAEFEPGKDDEK